MKNKYIISSLSVLLIISTAVMFFSLFKPNNSKAEFVPPAFEKNAEILKSDIPKDFLWKEFSSPDMPYKFGMSEKLMVKDNTADIYFLNFEGNNVWLKIRILDSRNEDILYESGLLKPGECLKSCTLKYSENRLGVKIKIMSYQPETYYSEGAVTLNTYIENK